MTPVLYSLPSDSAIRCKLKSTIVSSKAERLYDATDAAEPTSSLLLCSLAFGPNGPPHNLLPVHAEFDEVPALDCRRQEVSR